MHTDLRLARPGTVLDIVVRTNHGADYLAPSPEINDLVAGAIGYAQADHRVLVHSLAVMSNHLHLQASSDEPGEIGRFMCVALAAISREIGRLRGAPGHYFLRRYKAIPVSDEAEAQLWRLAYVLAQGAKEGLVDDPRLWPGLHSARVLLDGEEMAGTRWNRTAEHDSTPRQVELQPERFATRYVIEHSPLPALAHLEPAAYQARVRDALAALLADRCPRVQPPAEPVTASPTTPVTPLPVPPEPQRAEPIQDPLAEPACPAPVEASPDSRRRLPPPRAHRRRPRGPAPRVHAIDGTVRKALVEDLDARTTDYRIGADDLRAGRAATFPAYCHPPRLPYAAADGLLVPARA